ncbi:Hypothetical_protein [Hexamita inflata]|uniref:Hypothetical_protein n=1 Tax=Hexamita inflata TaxID=28002 RepID=A0AA86U178_9EUKA|nr:Hypothetical protein HINF_LOCUS24029 [Hexamita inflata]
MAIEDNFIYVVDRAKNVLAKHNVSYENYCGQISNKKGSEVTFIRNAYQYNAVVTSSNLYVQCFDKVYRLENKQLVLAFIIPNLHACTQTNYGMISSFDTGLYIINYSGQFYVYSELTGQLKQSEDKLYKQANFFQFCDSLFLLRTIYLPENKKVTRILHYSDWFDRFETVLQDDEHLSIQSVTFSQGGIMCVKSVKSTNQNGEMISTPQTQVIDMVPEPDIPTRLNIHEPVPTTNNQFRPVVGDIGLILDTRTLSLISDVTDEQIAKNKECFEEYAVKNIYHNQQIQKLVDFDVIIQYTKIQSGYVHKYNNQVQKFNNLSYKIRKQINNTTLTIIAQLTKTNEYLSRFQQYVDEK